MTDSPGLPPQLSARLSRAASDGERAEIFGATTYLIWSPNADSSYTDEGGVHGAGSVGLIELELARREHQYRCDEWQQYDMGS